MSVAIATTPTFTLTFTEQSLDLTQANNVYVTFEQLAKKITKTGNNLNVQEKSIVVYLSQSETLLFKEGIVDVQANWTGANGKRTSSEVAHVEFSKQLLKKVIE